MGNLDASIEFTEELVRRHMADVEDDTPKLLIIFNKISKFILEITYEIQRFVQSVLTIDKKASKMKVHCILYTIYLKQKLQPQNN